MNDDARRRAEAFVREVEAALVDLPHHRRAELTAGLVDHLLEPGEEGRRLIDDQPDPGSYADELRVSAPTTTGGRPPGRRVPYLAGTALLALVLAGAWIGVAHPWSSQPEPTPTTTTTSGPAQIQVPDVRGMSQEEARSTLESAGFWVRSFMSIESESNPLPTYLPTGTVLETDPFPGTLVDSGSEVNIMLNP